VIQGVVGHNFLFDNTNGPFIALLFALYSTGRHCPPRRFWVVLGALYASVVVAILTSLQGFESGDIVWLFLMCGLPVIAGRALRSRVLLQRELREKADRAEGERAARARRAIEEERDRIASELQAVVANGVNAMVIQAEAVPRLIAAEDTPAAGQALAAIEETGRDALAEMRRLLGVLRRDDDGLVLAPQPGLARLEALVERERQRGLEVDLAIEGEQRSLSAGVDLTAYRVLEDALQAAARQRAERASVLVRYLDGDLQLEVRDDRAGGASARLPGLRDRVGLYGGHLTVKREEGSGFTLRARLPIGEGAR
jgi:signal transduction histidine kinase